MIYDISLFQLLFIYFFVFLGMVYVCSSFCAGSYRVISVCLFMVLVFVCCQLGVFLVGCYGFFSCFLVSCPFLFMFSTLLFCELIS